MVRHLLACDRIALEALIGKIDCPFSSQDILDSIVDTRYECLVFEETELEKSIAAGQSSSQPAHPRLQGLCFSREVVGVVELFFIAVLPELRQNKIATALLQQLIQESTERSVNRIELEVRESNRAAVGLYERFGFSVCGERKNYYPASNLSADAREAAVLYALDL